MRLTKEQKKYLKKWDGLSKEDLIKEEEKWGEFLWLGRHLYLKHETPVFENYFKSGDEEKIKIAKDAFEAEERIVNKYENDPDFIRCMIIPESENGDKEWNEITNNVGSLRYLTCGDWFTDS